MVPPQRSVAASVLAAATEEVRIGIRLLSGSAGVRRAKPGSGFELVTPNRRATFWGMRWDQLQ